MRKVGEVQSRDAAETFLDFLSTEHIGSTVEAEEEGGWSVWVHADKHLSRARARLQHFLENPNDDRYAAAVEAARKRREDLARRQFRERMAERELAEIQAAARPSLVELLPKLSIVVALLSIVVATHSELGSHLAGVSWLMYGSDDVFTELLGGQVWRLITPVFVHGDLVHLAFGLMFWLDLGGSLERRRGPWFALGFLLVTAALSNTAQYLWAGPLFGGLSGVIYALLGYLWMRSRLDPTSGLVLRPLTAALLVTWLGICLTGAVGNTANAAHVAGLVVGLAWGGLEGVLRRR